MMMDEINNHPNIGHHSVNEHQKQDGISGVQVEWISKFLSDCPEAAQNVHKYLQQNYSNQQQQLIQPVNSTPKRGHPLDESGGSVNNGNVRHKYPRRGFQQDTRTKSQQHASPVSSNAQQQQVSNQNVTERRRIPFEQLKHAVSSNLPCFHIQFSSEVDRNTVPSALQASDFIFKELQKNGVIVNRFTLVGWIGKKLKLGVNNKEEYAALVATDKWPAKINGIDIEVLKPKFIPDSFALVVRYVPRELEEDFVTNEIKRTIASADRIKRIHYAYQRKSDDYRFDVKDYHEYSSILQLGRIAIGYSWLSITPFFPGNRLTYCTKCWCVGHLRNKCNATARCRVCLETLTDDHPQVCKSEPKCAQCDGKHHSLDNQCQTIQEYKHRLKEDVEDAIKSGKLQRFAPIEQAPPFELLEQEFPALNTVNNRPRAIWNTTQARTTNQSNTMNVLEIEKSFEIINNKLSELLDGNNRVENKVDQLTADLKTVTLDTQLHQAVLNDIVNTMKDFIQHFVPALLASSKLDRYSLVPVAEQFFSRFHSASTRLNDGFKLNRKVSSTPSAVKYNASQADRCSPLLSATTVGSASGIVKSSNTQNISIK
jgi:hypothetical protein